MAGGTHVRMVFPGDTEPTMVPMSRAKEAYEKAGARVYRPPLSTGQKAVKYFADAAPALGGFAGGLTAGAADVGAGLAAAPVTGGASAYAAALSAMPAIAGGSAVGGGLGSAAQLAAYKAAGIPFDDSMLGMLGHVGKGAFTEGALSVPGTLVGGLARSGAPAMAKAGLGTAEPGLERSLLSSKSPISLGSIDKFKSNISQLFDEITARGRELDAAGHKVGWKDLGQKLASNATRAEEMDVVSRKGENALQYALKTLRTKYGPQAKEATVRRSAGVGEHGGGQVIDPHFLVPEGDLLKPSKVVEIMRYSRQRINDLIEKRSVPGASPRPAGPLEKAYSDIYDRSLALLKDMDEGIGEAGHKISELYKLSSGYNKALKRGPGTVGTVASAVSGMPAPELASRVALGLNSRGGQVVPRAILSGADAVGRLSGAYGAPADATDAQMIDKATRRRK